MSLIVSLYEVVCSWVAETLLRQQASPVANNNFYPWLESYIRKKTILFNGLLIYYNKCYVNTSNLVTPIFTRKPTYLKIWGICSVQQFHLALLSELLCLEISFALWLQQSSTVTKRISTFSIPTRGYYYRCPLLCLVLSRLVDFQDTAFSRTAKLKLVANFSHPDEH